MIRMPGRWRRASIALGGGGVVVAGAFLPWMTLFAGLDRYPGIAGLYGRITLAGGAVAMVGGVLMLGGTRPAIRMSVGVLGVGLALFASWLVEGVMVTTRRLGGGAHAMMIARPGPGLFVVLVGALSLVMLLFPFPKGANGTLRARGSVAG